MTSQLINRVPLFADLGPQQQALVEERLQPVQFAPGQALFRSGEPATRMGIVESGYVRLGVARGTVLATLGTVDLWPWFSLHGQSGRNSAGCGRR